MKRATRYSLYCCGSLLVIYFLLLDTIAKALFESQASAVYGAEISIDSVELSPLVGEITLYQLQVADRSDAMRNLAQADRAYVDINILKLARNIIDVQQLDIKGLMVFAPRESAATILRPLVNNNSGLNPLGIPDFKVPAANFLIDQQRDKLHAELDDLKTRLAAGKEKWTTNIASLPSREDVAKYQSRIKKIKGSKGLAEILGSASDARRIYAEIQSDAERVKRMSKEFRGELNDIRKTLAETANIPARHSAELINSLGLSSGQSGGQIAQLGSQLLKGDIASLIQQALAPLAYSSGGASNSETSTPIFIDLATISGPLLPSSAGLSVEGELKNFAWPLEIADAATQLSLNGSSLNGGSLKLDATVDHRGIVKDLVSLTIDKVPLRNMALSANREMNILLQQSLATIAGEIRVDGDNLSGMIDQNFTQTVFDIALGDNASESARLIANVLQSSNDFAIVLGLGGTVQYPDISFKANLDDLLASTVEAAIAGQVNQLGDDLQNRISAEMGPQIAAMREQMQSLEALESGLLNTVERLSSLKPQALFRQR